MNLIPLTKSTEKKSYGYGQTSTENQNVGEATVDLVVPDTEEENNQGYRTGY